jgi:hypothetical protein
MVKNLKECFHFLAGCIFGLVVLIALTSSLSAQHWTHVFNRPTTTRVDPNAAMVPYFLNQQVGFIMTGVSPSVLARPGKRHPIFRTTNGGDTWDTLTICDSLSIVAGQLSFISLTNGYLAAMDFGDSGRGGIFETTDQGDHWKKISEGSTSFCTIYSIDSAIFATEYKSDISQQRSFTFSKDKGRTWDSITSIPHRSISGSFEGVTGNRDSLIAAIAFGTDSAYIILSTDQGNEWHTRTIGPMEFQIPLGVLWPSRGPTIPPHKCDLFHVVNGPIEDTYSFLHTSMNIDTWDTSFSHESSFWMTGTPCALYLTNANSLEPSGLFRSTNLGLSWEFIPVNTPFFGEMDDNDWRNLAVTGYGAVVYAADRYKQVWKTIDGGDGALSTEALAPRLLFDYTLSNGGHDTLVVNACDKGMMAVVNQNLTCAFTKITDISIQGLDSSEYSIKRIRHSSCIDLPDTTLFIIVPSQPGTRLLRVRAHFIDDEYATIDTGFTMTLIASSEKTPIRTYLKNDHIAARAGDTIDVPIFISPVPTEASVTLSGKVTGVLYFLVNADMVVPIRFIPAIKGLYASALDIANDQISFSLVDTNGMAITGETLLGKLRCVVYLTDTLQSSVTLIGGSLDVPLDANCFTLSVMSDSVIVSITYQCGDSILSNFIRYDSLFKILNIVPNPVGSTVHVYLRNNASFFRYELFDALGVVRKKGMANGNSFALDVSDLSAGKYYLRVRGPGGIPATEPIVIVR